MHILLGEQHRHAHVAELAQQLAYALRSSADSRLPTLILVEDFEMFVSDPLELQLVLNTLDGVATPDNPAGTLLLATSNDPEKIDPRIRDRPGRIDVLIEIGPVEDTGLAIRFLKHSFNADTDGLAGIQQLAGDATLLYYQSEEAQEGRNAFLEKRAPDFSKFPRFP